jgi:hypothetical protein
MAGTSPAMTRSKVCDIMVANTSAAADVSVARPAKETAMVRVVGIDHLVIRVGDYEKSKSFYDKLLKFLGF